MANFTKARAVVSTRSLEAHSKQQVLTNQTSIPPAVQNAMEQQGMWATNAWGPGAPINPIQPPDSEPRQFEYTIGQNIVQLPRSTEAVGFDTMKAILDQYDIAQMAIRIRQGELRSFEWGIVPEDEEDTDKYASEITQVRKFFEKPDGYMTFDEFVNQLSYDLWAYDAMTIYPHLSRGGKLGALEPVDGTTISPLVDWTGRTPQAPAPAYVQWMYGLPWTWLTRDQIIYRPFQRKNNKLYGTAPVEWLLTHINTDIRHQLYFLQYFTDGNVPASWINAPENMGPEQIKQLEDMYNAVMLGNQKKKHQIKMIPAGAKVQLAKDLKFDSQSALFLLTKTCAAWDVTPAELGFTEKVNKSSGETQENVQFRKSIKPTARYFESIFTHIIHHYFGYTNLYFKYLNLDEQEDMLLMAQRDEIYIKSGVVSSDEIRAERFGYEIDAQNPVPRMIITTSLVQTVDDAVKQSNAAVAQTEATTAQMLAQANQPATDANDGTQTDEEPQIDPKGDEEGKHPEITHTVEEREEAQKAEIDRRFLTKGAEPPKFKNPKTEQHVQDFAPKIHEVLQAEAKRFSAYAVRRMERLGKDANDPTDPNNQNADAILNGYTSPTFVDELNALLESFLVTIYVDAMTDAYTTVMPGFEVDQQFHAYADAYAKQRTAELVTKLPESTKMQLRGDLISMMNAGLSPYDMVQQLESDYAFSERRAFTIARTETGNAWNHGALQSYKVAGIGLVYVYDGDYDPECEEADGEVWTIEYAMTHLLEHPNCVRSFGPCLDDVTPDRGGEGYVEPEKTKKKGRR